MVRSKLPDVKIPEVTLQHEIFSQVERAGNQTVWVDGETGKSYTLNETKKISLQISKVLQDRGLKKGDVLAIFLHNCPEFAFMVYGCMALGVTVTTVSTAFTKEELSRQIKDAGATYIFTDDELAPKAKQMTIQTVQIKEIFTTGNAPGCTPFEEFTRYSGPRFEWEKIKFNPREDVIFIAYSSGTTGLPKGVMLTHQNLLANIAAIYNEDILCRTSGPSIQDRLLCVLPMYHLYGLFLSCGSITRGDMIVTMKKFIPDIFLLNIQKFKISDLFLVPPLVIFLIKSPMARKFDLASVKRVICGAAPLSKEVEVEFTQLLPHVQSFGQAYGMTELGPGATFIPTNKPKVGSIGIILPHCEVQTVDVTSGKVLGPNEMGEFWVRGPGVMKGYLNRPEETRKTIDDQGWLHSGDIGYYDEEGYYFVIDRLKELIKVKGLQVAPAELEALLLEHPDIADAAVTSVPDVAAGELPLGFVVTKPGVKLSEEQVKQFVAKHVAHYKQLKGGVIFLEEIPKSASGKILRRQLRAQTNKSKL